MQTKRCGNYVLEIELLSVPGTGTLLRVPVRRCLLSEHLFTLLMMTERGRDLVRKLVLSTSAIPAEQGNVEFEGVWRNSVSGANPKGDGAKDPGEPSPPLLRSALGPDLEPIHHSQCVVSRCTMSCTPGYRRLLDQYADVEVTEEVIPGCSEVVMPVAEYDVIDVVES